jgi:hypothetical protein
MKRKSVCSTLGLWSSRSLGKAGTLLHMVLDNRSGAPDLGNRDRLYYAFRPNGGSLRNLPTPPRQTNSGLFGLPASHGRDPRQTTWILPFLIHAPLPVRLFGGGHPLGPGSLPAHVVAADWEEHGVDSAPGQEDAEI